jgi:hypothetical protein
MARLEEYYCRRQFVQLTDRISALGLTNASGGKGLKEVEDVSVKQQIILESKLERRRTKWLREEKKQFKSWGRIC